MTFVPLETERLLLRRLETRDAVAVQSYAGDWDVVRFLADVPYPYPDGLAERWIKTTHPKVRAGTDYTLAAARRDDDGLIGTIQLKLDGAAAGGEIGYWFGRPFWGQGYATESVRRIVAFAFDGLALERVWAAAMPDNAASLRVLEKAGLKAEGVGDYDFPARGGIKRVAFHGLARDDADVARGSP